MDPSTAKWLSELEMDDPALNFLLPLMNSTEQQSIIIDDDIFSNQFSLPLPDHDHQVSEISTITSRNLIKPTIQLNKKSSPSNSPKIISFGNANANSNFPAGSSKLYDVGKSKYTVKTESDDQMMIDENHSTTALEFDFGPFYYKKGCNRTPLQAQDHVLAERKRREKLSQQFISLAAIVPGLKKLDKASVIEGAIKHIKQLEQRIELVEEKQEKKKRKIREESVVSEKRPRTTTSICYNYDDASDSSSCDHQSSSAAEVEVRTSGGDVLIRVLCKKLEGIINKFFSEMETLHLNITSSSFIPFGDGMLLINAVGQMDEEFSMTAEDLANYLPQAMLKFF